MGVLGTRSLLTVLAGFYESDVYIRGSIYCISFESSLSHLQHGEVRSGFTVGFTLLYNWRTNRSIALQHWTAIKPNSIASKRWALLLPRTRAMLHPERLGRYIQKAKFVAEYIWLILFFGCMTRFIPLEPYLVLQQLETYTYSQLVPLTSRTFRDVGALRHMWSN